MAAVLPGEDGAGVVAPPRMNGRQLRAWGGRWRRRRLPVLPGAAWTRGRSHGYSGDLGLVDLAPNKSREKSESCARTNRGDGTEERARGGLHSPELEENTGGNGELRRCN